MQGDSSQNMASAASVFRTYWSHTTQYPFLLIAVVIATVLIQAAELAVPLYLRQFFNIVATASPSDETVNSLLMLVAAIGAISLGRWALRRSFGFALMYFELRIMRDLTDSAFASLMRHSYQFFISRFAGSLTHKVNKFSRAYETMADSIILQFIPTILFVGGAIVVLYIQHHALGIALAGWSVLFIGFQVFVAKLRQPLRVERAERETQTTGALADAIGNHTTIVLFSGLTHEDGVLRSFTRRWYEAARRAWFADEWIWAGLGIFMLAIEIGLLWGATLLWQQGLLTVGDFVLIQAYLLTTFERLVAINRELRRFYDAYADASEMVALIEEPREIVDAPGAEQLRVTSGRIEFDSVTFAFPGSQPVFQNFSISIQGGEKVALVGPSGAGKSTVTRLLLRLYDVQGGAIRIDGHDIRNVQQAALRDAIGYVPQEPILFHRSLLENIRYGRRDATDEEVIEAAKRAHCHEFISTLPTGYSTYVGERGVKLSGGERQRIAIARAILKDAPILLLDEATSSLDSQSEAHIQEALEDLMQGKTVIAIAHRLSTVMKMDRIIVMQGGAAIAEGSHEQLLREQGLYRRLWNIQAGGFAPDMTATGSAVVVVDTPKGEDAESKEDPQGKTEQK